MTRIPENDRDILEQAIYLPMVIIILGVASMVGSL